MTLPAQLGIRVTPDLEVALKALRITEDEPITLTVRNNLEQFAALQTAELRGLRGHYTLRELGAMTSASISTSWDKTSRQHLATQIADAVEDHSLANFLSVDEGRALVQKLQALTPGQTVAVVLALEKWRANEFRTPDSNEFGGFARVGLIAAE